MAKATSMLPRPASATIVVAASNSMHPENATVGYLCDGVNDHLTIQAALDALPATGGEVFLLDGTYTIEVSLVLDSYQTLKGCGRNTILTTTTANLDIITATGGAGTEKVGITVADLCIDGDAGAAVNDNGIYFIYVDTSVIQNVWSIDNGEKSISLENCNYNIISRNVCEGSWAGVFLANGSDDNTITGNSCRSNRYGIYIQGERNTVTANVCQANTTHGIELQGAVGNTVLGNTVVGNTLRGIFLTTASHNNVIADNIIQGNGYEGIVLSNICDHNVIIGNHLLENSQDTSNTYDDIYLEGSDYNNIQANTFRAGALANKPRYGININDAACKGNLVIGNDLHDDGFGTGSFNDVGTLTHVEDNNRGISIDQIKMFRHMKNTSGAQRVAGDVVSLKAVAAGNEVTAPAAVGERQVYGMVAETIDDAAWGLVQVKGKTTALKGTNVGGGNIVIGDNLITENGVRARKAAAATDPIFARALEALAAANGVIDAYICSPWD